MIDADNIRIIPAAEAKPIIAPVIEKPRKTSNSISEHFRTLNVISNNACILNCFCPLMYPMNTAYSE
jgi:hypothetical protein